MAARTFVALIALFLQDGAGSQQVPRVFQSVPLHWEAPPATLHMNWVEAHDNLRFFYPDGRFFSLGTQLWKAKGYRTVVLLTEGFTMRFGTWQKQGSGFSSHSIYGHLAVKITPEPGPVDESYVSRFDPMASSKLVATGAREGKLVLVPAAHITNLKDVRESIEGEICSVVASSPSTASDPWRTFCATHMQVAPAKK